MKNLLITSLFVAFALNSFGQNYTIQDNSTSVTILPNALKTNIPTSTGIKNTVLGENTMKTFTTGSKNVAIGDSVLANSYYNRNCTVIGSGAMALAGSSIFNTVIGYKSMNRANGGFNVAIGIETFSGGDITEIAAGGFNTIIGAFAGKKSSGDYNIALGTNALYNGGGNNNIVLGTGALYNNGSGNSNIAIGEAAMSNNLAHPLDFTSDYNIAIGKAALLTSSGKNNIAIGRSSMGFGSNSINSGNVAIGQSSLENVAGSYNSAFGATSLLRNTGNNNVAFGTGTLSNNIIGNNNVAIGYNAGYNELNSNKLYIENSNSSTPLIGGDFANDKIGINRPIASLTNTFEVGGEASKAVAGSWLANSDKRLKKSIIYMNSQEILQKVLQMKGVSYEWNDDKTGMARPTGIQFGFIAQDLQQVFPTKVKEDKQGYLQTAYGDYDPMFVEAIRALNDKIEKLEKENSSLRADNKVLMEMKDEFAEIKALILKKSEVKFSAEK
jgi:trimeric autotransporter adhesin